MKESNFERMLKLVDEFFDVKNDPDQLAVTPAVLEKLKAMDPSATVEVENEDGPIAWILLVPTTGELMKRFLGGSLSEQRLFDQSPVGARYEAVYLCSAVVLPEFRRKGIAREATSRAIKEISCRHPITSLFLWAFSEAGINLAGEVAHDLNLPLYNRPGSPRQK
jgi:ribosomal protein S18 acetylase RimI-like enzyme